MRLHRSQIFVTLLVAFLLGIFLGHFFNPSQTKIFLFLVSTAAIVTGTVAWGRKGWLVAAVLLSVALGAWRYQNAQPAIDGSHIASFNGTAAIIWEGTITTEPDIRSDRINLTVEAESLIVPEARAVKGRVLVTAPRYPEYRYGDRLRVQGKLEIPFETQEFSYRDYLAKSNIFSTVRFARIERINGGLGNPAIELIFAFKTRFLDALASVLPEPQLSLLAGLLVGARRGIPADILDLFKITGVTHIIAISGFNISIITRVLGSAIQRRFGPRLAVAVSAFVVCGFVIITGAQASVVRAAIMGMLVVASLAIGRINTLGAALILAGAVMVALNPSILVFDLGFQLSFLATAGIIFFAENMERAVGFLPKALELRSTMAATLAAQLLVLPLLIANFGQLSLVTPIANLLILPTIPTAMFFGFLSGLLALISPLLGYLTAWIDWALLWYQIGVVKVLGSLPYAAISVEAPRLPWIVSYYIIVLLAAFVIRCRRRNRIMQEFLNPDLIS